MVKAIDIQQALSRTTPLKGRRPDTSGDAAEKAFATLAKFGDGAIFAGSFEGDSPWERHGKGDEIVQVLAGETELTILTDDGETVLKLQAGMLTVVPQGCWHRFHAPKGVTVMTATPQPTDHQVEDPRG
jgi:uncharacterized cupin superfamily protein